VLTQVLGGGQSHVSGSERGGSVSLLLLSSFVMARLFSVRRQYGGECVDAGGQLCSGVLFLMVWFRERLSDSYFHSCIWHTCKVYNQFMISSVYQIYFNTHMLMCKRLESLSFRVFVCILVHALTFVLLVCSLYLTNVVLFNTVSYNLK